VPAGLGIDVPRQRISPLHTHHASGVIHIESGRDIPYTLGQLFVEWGQPLPAHQVGPHRLAPGEVLRVFRNGHPVSGDPAALRFAQHDEDLVWVGPANARPTVPAAYPFPQGLELGAGAGRWSWAPWPAPGGAVARRSGRSGPALGRGLDDGPPTPSPGAGMQAGMQGVADSTSS
jgi:hypothetical protein